MDLSYDYEKLIPHQKGEPNLVLIEVHIQPRSESLKVIEPLNL